ncbi:MAG: hypothetical protein ACYDH5_13305 [Acidimicrobiales bacterium]
MADLEGIRERLEQIAEELADAALEDLKETLRRGGDSGLEKKLTRARRAVEKAAHLIEVEGPERT